MDPVLITSPIAGPKTLIMLCSSTPQPTEERHKYIVASPLKGLQVNSWTSALKHFENDSTLSHREAVTDSGKQNCNSYLISASIFILAPPFFRYDSNMSQSDCFPDPNNSNSLSPHPMDTHDHISHALTLAWVTLPSTNQCSSPWLSGLGL